MTHPSKNDSFEDALKQIETNTADLIGIKERLDSFLKRFGSLEELVQKVQDNTATLNEVKTRLERLEGSGTKTDSDCDVILERIQQYPDDKIEDEVEEARSQVKRSLLPKQDFMSEAIDIRAPYQPSEPIVEKALKKLSDDPEYSNSRVKLVNLIINKGITSEIKEVTKYISQRRTSPLRKKIWATGFAHTTISLLDSHKDPDLEKIVDDTYGLARKIMSKLEEPEGPVSRFTDSVFKLTLQRNQLNEPTDICIIEQVKAQIKAEL